MADDGTIPSLCQEEDKNIEMGKSQKPFENILVQAATNIKYTNKKIWRDDCKVNIMRDPEGLYQ